VAVAFSIVVERFQVALSGVKPALYDLPGHPHASVLAVGVDEDLEVVVEETASRSVRFLTSAGADGAARRPPGQTWV
jgi:hypothetical protein